MSKYKIVEADLAANRQDIVNLMSRNAPEKCDQEARFEWLYRRNPNGSPKCFLVKEIEKGTYVGCGTVFPRRIVLDGKTVMAGIVGDTMVDKNHRTLGPALMLQRRIMQECTENSLAFIYGVPNEFSEVVNVRLGYKVIGRFVRMVRYLRSEQLIARFANNLIARVVSVPLDGLLYLGLLSWGKSRGLGNIKCDFSDHFGEDFNALWKNTARQEAITGERTDGFLGWRYGSHPSKKFEVFTAKREKEGLLGYIVFTLENGDAHIYDMIGGDFDSVILDMFLQECRKTKGVNAVTVDVLEGSRTMKKLERKLFLKRKGGLSLVLYCDGAKSQAVYGAAENWQILCGDTDE